MKRKEDKDVLFLEEIKKKEEKKMTTSNKSPIIRRHVRHHQEGLV
jgi:hypothetical protein